MSKRRQTEHAKAVQFKAIQLFVTYPQNPVTKEMIVERLLERFPDNVEWIVACNEDHEPQDEDQQAGVHAHFICRFKKPRTNVTHKNLDYVGGDKHGDYQCMKGGFVKAANYIIKHGDYITWGFKDFEAELAAKDKKKSPVNALIYKKLQDGEDLEDMKDDPELGPFIMMNLQKLQYYWQHLQVWNMQVDIIYGLYDNLSPDMNDDSRDILDFLASNLMYPREAKQKQGWIYGDTNLGKTQLKEQLRRRFKVFISGSKDMLKGYRNNYYDIIIIDEPSKGQYRCEDLNKLLEGSIFPIPSRYADMYKTDNPLVLILTNYAPEEFYPNISELGLKTFNAFKGRIEQFLIIPSQPIRIYADIYKNNK